MNEFKPPGLIKRIYFQKLTLGNSPVRHVVNEPCSWAITRLVVLSVIHHHKFDRVEGIRVDKTDKAEIAIEVQDRNDLFISSVG